METKPERYFRRLISGLFSFYITVSFFGWTGPLHEDNPWHTLLYTIMIAYASYKYISNSILEETEKEKEKERLKKLDKDGGIIGTEGGHQRR